MQNDHKARPDKRVDAATLEAYKDQFSALSNALDVLTEHEGKWLRIPRDVIDNWQIRKAVLECMCKDVDNIIEILLRHS